MRCRVPLVLALGLLTGVAGCSQSLSGVRLFSTGQKPPPDAILKPTTYVAFADYRAQSGFAKELPEASQLLYREEARVSYLKAIEVDAKNLPAHLGLARLLTNWERHGEAVAAYQKAIALSPNDAGLWYELGMCRCRGKEWLDAATCLAKAVELAPRQGRYSAHLGLALARAGRHAKALAALTQAVGEAQANYDLARMLQHMNQPRLAHHYAAEALRVDPNLAGARAMLTPPQPAAPSAPAPAPEVRTVSHEVGGPLPQIITPGGGAGAKAPPPPGPLPAGLAGDEVGKPAESAHRPIRVPPMPVISIRRK